MTSLGLVNYAGGKARQLDLLAPLIPLTRGYVEPFGGSGVVLLNRPASQCEVYNDLNGFLVDLFRVVRDESLCADLTHRVELTLCSREEFERAVDIYNLRVQCPDPVERAWAVYVLLNQGISGKLHSTYGQWSRDLTASKNSIRFRRRFEALPFIHERLKYVQIERRDALEVMTTYDAADTTFYLDPPYVLSTRQDERYYAYEYEDADHEKLVEHITGLKGAVVMSGYQSPLYAPLLDCGWALDTYSMTTSMNLQSDQNVGRVEAVYRNRQACELSVQNPLW